MRIKIFLTTLICLMMSLTSSAEWLLFDPSERQRLDFLNGNDCRLLRDYADNNCGRNMSSACTNVKTCLSINEKCIKRPINNESACEQLNECSSNVLKNATEFKNTCDYNWNEEMSPMVSTKCVIGTSYYNRVYKACPGAFYLGPDTSIESDNFECQGQIREFEQAQNRCNEALEVYNSRCRPQTPVETYTCDIY